MVDIPEAGDAKRPFLLIGGLALTAITLLEFIAATALVDSGGGANIGAGVAIMAMFAGLAANVCGLVLKRRELRTVGRSLALGVGILALVFGAQMAVLVAMGIVEELA